MIPVLFYANSKTNSGIAGVTKCHGHGMFHNKLLSNKSINSKKQTSIQLSKTNKGSRVSACMFVPESGPR